MLYYQALLSNGEKGRRKKNPTKNDEAKEIPNNVEDPFISYTPKTESII
jgi:hypothetical protein